MANIKITDLDAYTDPESTDVLPIVDIDADETKKVSIADLMENAGSGTDALPGISFNGDPDTGISRPGANQLGFSTGGTRRMTISDSGAVTIPGALTVEGNATFEGTTTFIDSTNLQVEDKNIELGKVGTPTDTTANGGGITLLGDSNHTITWTNSTDSWDFSEHVNLASAKEFKINGTSVLSATTLGSGVTGSSLTSVGTIATGTWQGTPIATAYIADDAVNADKLNNTTVTAGSYTAADITVDAQGRITSAASGTVGSAEIANDAVGPDQLANTAVTAGSYTAADITVDAQGRITSAASGTISTTEIADDAVTPDKLEDTAVTAGSYTAADITVDAQGRITSASNGTVGVTFPIDGGDNDKIRLGASQDLEIYHDGSSSYLHDAGSGGLIVRASRFRVNNAANTENIIRGDEDGAVYLYHDNSQKLITTSTGIDVTGNIECDGGNVTGQLNVNKLVVDDDGATSPTFLVKTDDNQSSGLVVKNDGYSTNEEIGFKINQDNSGAIKVMNVGNSEYKGMSFQTLDGDGGVKNAIVVNPEASVELYYDNGSKLQTASGGINVTGTVTCDGLTCDGSGTINGLGTIRSTTGVLVLEDNNDGAAGGAQNYIEGRTSDGSARYRIGDVTTSGHVYISNITSNDVIVQTGGTTRCRVNSSGHVTPESNSTYDLGTSSLRWRNIYASKILGGSQAYTVGFTDNNGDIILNNGSTDTPGIHFYYGDNTNFGIDANSTSGLRFVKELDETGGAVCAAINTDGHFVPGANNTRDLGTSALRWRNVYTNDLNLSNEGSANDVDGTWGNYTIQEGEDDLFLINRRNGKKYKFNLTEVN